MSQKLNWQIGESYLGNDNDTYTIVRLHENSFVCEDVLKRTLEFNLQGNSKIGNTKLMSRTSGKWQGEAL